MASKADLIQESNRVRRLYQSVAAQLPPPWCACVPWWEESDMIDGRVWELAYYSGRILTSPRIRLYHLRLDRFLVATAVTPSAGTLKDRGFPTVQAAITHWELTQ